MEHQILVLKNGANIFYDELKETETTYELKKVAATGSIVEISVLKTEVAYKQSVTTNKK